MSLNNYINATIAASVAQEETLRFFDERLRNVDIEALHKRMLQFMSETQPGDGPTVEQVQKARGSG